MILHQKKHTNHSLNSLLVNWEGDLILKTEGIHIRLIILPVGEMSKEYSIHGTRRINANNIGNKTVQQNVISLSNLIRGKEAAPRGKPILEDSSTSVPLFSPKVISSGLLDEII